MERVIELPGKTSQLRLWIEDGAGGPYSVGGQAVSLVVEPIGNDDAEACRLPSREELTPPIMIAIMQFIFDAADQKPEPRPLQHQQS